MILINIYKYNMSMKVLKPGKFTDGYMAEALSEADPEISEKSG